MTRVTLIASLALLGACKYDEGLVIRDITGTVTLPEDAATRTVTHTDGTDHDITDDPRLLGPVYLGLYPSVREGLYEYSHPEIGPVFQTGVPGDTYPYGGTSVGDFRYACFQQLTCRVVSGRFVDFDDMVGWFNDELDQPFTDAFGNKVDNGEYVRQTCYDLLHYTSDEEIRITATEDKNEDGSLDAGDLDFVQQNDGTWEAEFTIWQQEYFENAEDGTGFTLWGWMDAPSESFRFSTCNPEEGYYQTEYNAEYYAGVQYDILLNRPAQFISGGDYVSSEGFVFGSPDDSPTLTLDYKVKN